MRTHSATTQPVTASPCLAHTSGSALPDLQARKAALTAPQRLLMCLCTAFSVALGAGAAVSDMLHAAGDTCAESKESAAEQAGALAVKMSSAGGAPRRRQQRAPRAASTHLLPSSAQCVAWRERCCEQPAGRQACRRRQLAGRPSRAALSPARLLGAAAATGRSVLWSAARLRCRG